MKFFPLIWRNLGRRKMRTIFTLLSVFVAFVLFGILMAIRVAFSGAITIAGSGAAGDDRQDLAHQSDAAQLPAAAAVGRRGQGHHARQLVRRHLPGAEELLREHGRRSRELAPHLPGSGDAGGSEEGMARRPHRRGRRHRDRRSVSAGRSATACRCRARFTSGRTAARGSSRSAGSTSRRRKASTTASSSSTTTTSTRRSATQALRHDQVGWYVIKVADPAQSRSRSRQKLDAMFANSPSETKTSTEKAFVAGFAKQIGDIGQIMVWIAARGAVHDPARLGEHDGAGDTRADQRARRAEDAWLQRRADPGAGARGILPGGASRRRCSGSGLRGSSISYAGDPTHGMMPPLYLPDARCRHGARRSC